MTVTVTYYANFKKHFQGRFPRKEHSNKSLILVFSFLKKHLLSDYFHWLNRALNCETMFAGRAQLIFLINSLVEVKKCWGTMSQSAETGLWSTSVQSGFGNFSEDFKQENWLWFSVHWEPVSIINQTSSLSNVKQPSWDKKPKK